MSALALAPLPQTPAADNYWTHRGDNRVNPLQRLITDAMREHGMPPEVRGSKAELARRSGVEDAIISNVLNRPRYVPDERVRQALATALGIPRQAIDSAASEIKGFRVYTNPPPAEGQSATDIVQRLDADVADFFLALDEMSDEERDEAVAKIDELAEEIRRRTKGE